MPIDTETVHKIKTLLSGTNNLTNNPTEKMDFNFLQQKEGKLNKLQTK